MGSWVLDKLFLLIVFSILLFPLGIEDALAGNVVTQITVIKTVTGGGPLNADSFDLFVDDGFKIQVQNEVPQPVNPGVLIITESLSGPLSNQYLPTFSGDCNEDSLNDDRRKQIFALVSKTNTLQFAINSEPGNPLNDDREQSIHDLLSKARTLLSALSATVPISQGDSKTCEITNDFLPLLSAEIGNQPVGGKFIPIDTAALILAGAQSVSFWVIPVIASGIGFVLVFTKNKRS